MRFSGSVEDRLAIRELYGLYSDAAMRQDRALYLSCWCEDGVRVSERGELRGKAAIAAHWDGLWSSIRQMGFFVEVAQISAAADTACAVIYCREIVAFKDGRIWKLIGRYHDRLEASDGRWCFKHRQYDIVLDEGMTMLSAAGAPALG